MSDTITVGTSDEHIREAIRRHALDEAEGPYRAEIAALYETFDAHNAAFFGGELRPVTITISPPQSARAVADAREHSGWGGYQEMRIRPSVVVGEHPTGAYADTPKPGWRMRPGRRGTEGHRRWLSDLVLHEMVHLLLNQRRDPRRNDHKGHGAPYTAECNRVSALLGLPGVKARRRKGEPRELPISPDWPFCVRPGGEHGAYYGDLWERVEVEREAPEEPATAGERMLAIWWHEDTPEGERVRFLRKAGLARVGGVEVIDEPPTEAASPLTERVTINAGKKGVPLAPAAGAPGEWLRIKEAARRLGVAPKTVRDRIEGRKLPWRHREDGNREVFVAERAQVSSDGVTTDGLDPANPVLAGENHVSGVAT